MAIQRKKGVNFREAGSIARISRAVRGGANTLKKRGGTVPGGGVVNFGKPQVRYVGGGMASPERVVTYPGPKNKTGLNLPGLGKLPKPKKGEAKSIKQIRRAVAGGANTLNKSARAAAPRASAAAPAAPSRPAATPRAAAPAPRGSSGGGGAAGGSAGTAPKRPRRTVSRGPKAPAADPAASTSQADVTAQSIMDEFFGPAVGELDRLEGDASKTRELQVGDAGRLGDWMSGNNAAAESFLERNLAASRAATAQNPLLAEAQRRAQEAAGTSVDMQRAIGYDAATAAQAARAPGDAAAQTLPELNAGAFTRGLADQRGVTNATMANIRSGIDSSFNNRLSELANQRSQLASKAGELAVGERASARQAAQDDRMFQLIAKEKMGNLAVAQTNAKTKRMQVLTTAENARAALDLKAQVEQGKLSRDEARLRLDAKLKSQNLSIAKRKLELARFDSETKRMTATGAQVSKMSDYVQSRYDKFISQYGAQSWDQVPRDAQRRVVRNIITGLRGSGGANLTQAQVVAILGGVFGDIPVRDPAFRQMVTQLWPR